MQYTIKRVLDRAVLERAERTALRFKRKGYWQTYTYRRLHLRARRVSQLCANLGVKPGDRVAIYCENSPEWFELYYGIVGLGAVAVPVDAKLRKQEVSHIFRDCGVSVAFCSPKNADILNELHDRLQRLSSIVLLDESYEAHLPDDTGAYDQHDPMPDDLASLIYTSGTTGRQKGAMLTHRNFVSNVVSCRKAIDIRKTDNFLLVLPLHHSFAFTTSLLLPAFAQCEVSLVENLKSIKASMKETSPTVLLAVPLLLEKMLARIQAGIQQNFFSLALFKAGLTSVIGRKIHAELGGALRVIVSGGASIDPDTLKSWNKLGFDIIEGYGITETGPVLSLNPLDAPRPGTVGLPLPDVQIQILDPKADGSGEIAAKGPNVMTGYYNNPDATGECLRDGWFLSGDLGFFDDDGYLVINGRKKSLIVNREGKNIYPEEIEQHVAKSRYILECLALGYRGPGATAGERVGLIAVPDQNAFDDLETREKRRMTDQQIEETLCKEVRRLTADLSDFKRPRQIQVRFEEFEKTTTSKIKRYMYAIDTSHL